MSFKRITKRLTKIFTKKKKKLSILEKEKLTKTVKNNFFKIIKKENLKYFNEKKIELKISKTLIKYYESKKPVELIFKKKKYSYIVKLFPDKKELHILKKAGKNKYSQVCKINFLTTRISSSNTIEVDEVNAVINQAVIDIPNFNKQKVPKFGEGNKIREQILRKEVLKEKIEKKIKKKKIPIPQIKIENTKIDRLMRKCKKEYLCKDARVYHIFPNLKDHYKPDQKTIKLIGDLCKNERVKSFNVTTFDKKATLHGFIYTPPKMNKYTPVIFCCGGNVGTAEYIKGLMDKFPEYAFITYSKRGEGFSTSSNDTMSEMLAKQDAYAVFKAMLKQFENNPIFIRGYSLGGGIASYLARLECKNKQVKGLDLSKTFCKFSESAYMFGETVVKDELKMKSMKSIGGSTAYGFSKTFWPKPSGLAPKVNEKHGRIYKENGFNTEDNCIYMKEKKTHILLFGDEGGDKEKKGEKKDKMIKSGSMARNFKAFYGEKKSKRMLKKFSIKDKKGTHGSDEFAKKENREKFKYFINSTFTIMDIQEKIKYLKKMKKNENVANECLNLLDFCIYELKMSINNKEPGFNKSIIIAQTAFLNILELKNTIDKKKYIKILSKLNNKWASILFEINNRDPKRFVKEINNMEKFILFTKKTKKKKNKEETEKIKIQKYFQLIQLLIAVLMKGIKGKSNNNIISKIIKYSSEIIRLTKNQKKEDTINYLNKLIINYEFIRNRTLLKQKILLQILRIKESKIIKSKKKDLLELKKLYEELVNYALTGFISIKKIDDLIYIFEQFIKKIEFYDKEIILNKEISKKYNMDASKEKINKLWLKYLGILKIKSQEYYPTKLMEIVSKVKSNIDILAKNEDYEKKAHVLEGYMKLLKKIFDAKDKINVDILNILLLDAKEILDKCKEIISIVNEKCIKKMILNRIKRLNLKYNDFYKKYNIIRKEISKKKK
ncbi:hypothetical protein ACFL2K_01560 [Candidatus Margulisiibacteriota bacterium]